MTFGCVYAIHFVEIFLVAGRNYCALAVMEKVL